MRRAVVFRGRSGGRSYGKWKHLPRRGLSCSFGRLNVSARGFADPILKRQRSDRERNVPFWCEQVERIDIRMRLPRGEAGRMPRPRPRDGRPPP
jgi:hypothetical protein